MDKRDIEDAEAAADELAYQLRRLLFSDPAEGFTIDQHRERADLEFRQLALSLGYTVTPKADGINTGKPVVAGGF